jgi:hypothetical protein
VDCVYGDGKRMRDRKSGHETSSESKEADGG